ncbi:MAG: hypothetical protein Q8N33_02610, partial [Rhodocyclaceae bacterium]|nr:hypothetical protein [Rhodocyclaceae bacterium]
MNAILRPFPDHPSTAPETKPTSLPKNSVILGTGQAVLEVLAQWRPESFQRDMMETFAHNRSDLRFRLDPEAKVLIAVATPGPASQSIDEAWLRDELVAQGYGALRYLPRAALPLLANYNSGKAVVVKIAECIDASLKIDTSPDGLEA